MRNKVQINRNTPKWIWIIFIVSFPGATLYVFEVIYELTYLTWKNGTQNIGFTLVHNYSTLFFFFILSLLTLCLWLVIVFLWSLINFKLVAFSKKLILSFGLSVTIVLLYMLPEGFYQRTTVRLLGNGDHTVDIFIDSAAKGDIKSIKFYLRNGVDVNSQNKEGRTALMAASVENKKEVINLLIDKGADINKRDHFHHTSLKDAVYGGHIEIARLLINKGADINELKYDSLYYSSDTKSNNIEISNMKKQDSIIYILYKEYVIK